jgi:hypothetical protein
MKSREERINAATNDDVTNSFVLAGMTPRIEVTVRNKVNVDRTSKVTLYVDRSRSSSWDFLQTSAQKTVPADSTEVFTFTYRPSRSGTYYRQARVETCYSFHDAFAFTDLPAGWTSAFTATLNITIRNT